MVPDRAGDGHTVRLLGNISPTFHDLDLPILFFKTVQNGRAGQEQFNQQQRLHSLKQLQRANDGLASRPRSLWTGVATGS